MSTQAIATENFEDVIGSGIVLVDWWASWCGPCRSFAPVYEAASERHPDVVFAKVDTDAQPELAAAAQIRAIPTLMAFRDGLLLYRDAGVLPARALDELIERIRELDMDEIRKKITKAKAGEPKPASVA